MECWYEKRGDKYVFCYKLDNYWYKQHYDKWIWNKRDSVMPDAIKAFKGESK